MCCAVNSPSSRSVSHNPSHELLHVREVFTTESFLHLHLPDSDGKAEVSVEDAYPGPNSNSTEAMWQIPGRGEKEIIHLRFRTSTPGVYTGYVHVKTDRENMVLPVELEVLQGGLHPTPKEFDFGILTSPKEQRVVPISLLNSGDEPVALTGVSPENHEDKISVIFQQGVVIPPGEVVPNVVRLIYSGEIPGKVAGRVLLTTNHSNAGVSVVDVHYKATVLHGGVGYERGQVSFVVPANLTLTHDAAGQVVRRVSFTNYFKIPLVLRSAVIETCTGALTISPLPEVRCVLLHRTSFMVFAPPLPHH